MVATISFFSVGNGDMTLIRLEDGKTILIDINIINSSEAPGAAKTLKESLKRDIQNRLYVDVFILSHPDQDHCRGLEQYFHLGLPQTYSVSDDKILIREIWSSPIVFRRASKILTLSDDAKAFNTEARRRVEYFRENRLKLIEEGNRIQILGEDENGKTDDLTSILVKVGDSITKINGAYNSNINAQLLGPLPKSDDEKEEEALAKNRSSVIIRFNFCVDGVTVCRFLTAGDAEVAVWERLWQLYQKTDLLKYDILLAPHHCSWHSLSHDSISKLGSNAQVNQDAKNALSQSSSGAIIVASSKAIKDDDSDPPSFRAKQEYETILKKVSGSFKCTGEEATGILEFEIGQHGLRLKSKLITSSTIRSTGAIGRQPLAHG